MKSRTFAGAWSGWAALFMIIAAILTAVQETAAEIEAQLAYCEAM